MGKTQSVRTFLARVAEQRSGFKFGEPERVKEDGLAAVIPILRVTSRKRQYVTFPETEKVDVTDTGRIDQFLLRNGEAECVFVRAGTIFKGATQERCLVRSAVVFPGKEQPLEVRCVHQSKGINRGSKTSYGGISPLEMDKSSHDAGYRPKSQHDYWSAVSEYSRAVKGEAYREPSHEVRTSGGIVMPQQVGHARRSILRAQGMSAYAHGMLPDDEVSTAYSTSSAQTKHDDLHSTVHEFATNIDDVLRRVKRQPNQVGLGVITDKGCETIELFDLPDSWAALHQDAVKRVGQDLSRKAEDVFQYKPEYAVKTVCAVLADEYQENVILEVRGNGDPPVRITGLTSERFIGEVVELDGHVIHVVLNRRM